MEFLLILLLIFAVFAINWIIAEKFESIANEKGYSGYLWWCFWLGIIGYLMVVALPNRNVKSNTKNSHNTDSEKPCNAPTNSDGFSLHTMAIKRENHQKTVSGKWSCKNCGTLNNSTDIQCKDCGKYR